MTEGLPDRVQQLHQRWAADPASRIFLQLAEEYRHLGRLQDSLGVLDAGLKEHPGYLSALVAKGRCHLELGQPEAAREALERVVQQDATQMVANKLLVRAYLETGQVDRARERLGLYSLLHDGDPETAELHGRIRRMEAPRMDSSSLGAAPSIAARSAEPAPPAQDDLFDLGPVTLVRPAAATEDLFDLGIPDRPAPAAARGATPEAEAPGTPQHAEMPDAGSAALDAADAADASEEPDLEAERAAADLFPGLVSRPIRQRYLESLGSEGLFLLDPGSAPEPSSLTEVALTEPAAAPWPPPVPTATAEMPAVPTMPPMPELIPAAAPGQLAPAEPEPFDLDLEPGRPAPPAWEPPPATGPMPAAPEPSFGPEEAPAEPDLLALGSGHVAAPPSFEPGEVSVSPPSPAPAEELAPAAPAAPTLEPATVTLGEIYLRQGHLDEAGRIFEEVLRRDPGNRAALDGLARSTAGREEGELASAATGTPLPAAQPDAAAEPVSQRRRKIALLNSYLERLRRGSQRDVS